MKKKTFEIIAVMVMLLLLSLQANAGLFKPILKELIIAPLFRAAYAFNLLVWINTKASLFAKNFYELILFNPSPYNNPEVLNLMGLFIKVIQPFYILGIAIIAFYLLFVSGSPKGRTNAKYTLFRLIISMFLFSLSPLLLNLLLQFSANLTESAFRITGTEPIKEILLGGIYGMYTIISFWVITSFGLGTTWSFTVMSFVAWMPYIFISIRNIVLVVLEIFFPLTIFLYSFNYTRGIGRTLLEQTITWTILQFFWALVLVALALSLPIRDAFVDNPKIGNVSIPILSSIPGLYHIAEFVAPLLPRVMPIPGVMSTDVFTAMLGFVGYAMVCALPFTLIALIRGVLP